MLPEDLSAAEKMFAVLIPHASRWRTLSITTESHVQRHLVRRTLEPLSVPLLTYFLFRAECFFGRR